MQKELLPLYKKLIETPITVLMLPSAVLEINSTKAKITDNIQ